MKNPELTTKLRGMPYGQPRRQEEMGQRCKETFETSLSTTSTDGDKMKSRSNLKLVTSGLSVGNLLTQSRWTNHERDNSAPIVSIGRTRPAWMPSLPLICRSTSPKRTIDIEDGTRDTGMIIALDYTI